MKNDSQLITKELPTIIQCEYKEEENNDDDWRRPNREKVLHIVNNKPVGKVSLDIQDAVDQYRLSSSPYSADFAL